MSKKLTPEEGAELFYSVANNEYEMLTPYTRYCDYIKVRHKKCGKEYLVKFHNFYYLGNRCTCENKYGPKTKEYYKKQFDEHLNGRSLKYIDCIFKKSGKREYKYYYKVQCIDCGKIYNIQMNSFINGDQCICHYKNRKKSISEWKEIFYQYFRKEDFEFLDINYKTQYITYKCNKCGRKDKIHINRVSSIINTECICVRPYNRRHKTHEDWAMLFYKKADPNIYEFIDYVKILNSYYYKFKHIESGQEYMMQPYTFDLYFTNNHHDIRTKYKIIGRVSYGVSLIVDFLTRYKIEFFTEFIFNNCRDVRALPFDFYLPKFNMCIEFDGEQHFIPKFGEEKFKDTVSHDNIKNEFCKNNGIKLLRIPYWKFDSIDKILMEELEI